MQKLLGYINRFVFGEVSPLLCARGDLVKYSAGCKEMVNFIPLLQGPARRRGGTRFIARSGNGSKPVALLEFAFSETVTYIIEAGDGYLRFFSGGAPVLKADGTPYQIASPWRQADLFYDNGIRALKYVQSGDILFIVCPGQPPKRLSRYGHTDWRIDNLPGWLVSGKSRPNAAAVALWRERLCLAYDQTICLSQSGAFNNFAPGLRGLTEAVITSYFGLTFDAASGVVTANHTNSAFDISFIADEVTFSRVTSTKIAVRPKEAGGRITRIGFTPTRGSVIVTVSSVAGTISGRTAASGSGSTVLSFDPALGNITLDASADNAYTVSSMDIPVAADDPLEITVYSEQTDRITWMCPGDDLLVGTAGGEFRVSPTTSADPLGPENVKVVPETSYGSSAIQALRVGAVMLFVQRAGRKVREFVWDYAGDNYVAADVTSAAEHITRGGLLDLVWQSEPMETLWAVRADGTLLGFTYSKDQEMAAWHRHNLGGGLVSQLAVLPAAHGGRDELWLSVRRVVGGADVFYIERMEAGLEDGAAQAEAFFVDSGVTARGERLTEVGGLGHLEGLGVDILADGGPQGRQVVRGGRVALKYPADVVQVGLPYRSLLTTVNMDVELRDGTAQTRRKKVVRVALRLVESLGGAVGPAPDHLQDIYYRLGSDPLDPPPPLFSGDKTIDWPGGYDREGAITIVQDQPLPLTVAAVIPEVNIEGMHS